MLNSGLIEVGSINFSSIFLLYQGDTPIDVATKRQKKQHVEQSAGMP